MAIVTGFTAERMLEIENTTVVSGLVDVNGDLLLYTREGAEINAGHVKGDPGDPGDDATVPDASETVKGKAELATSVEVQDGTDTSKIVTPSGLSSLTGTTSRRGLLEIATLAEVRAGTDTQRAVVPADLRAVQTGQAVVPSSITRSGGSHSVLDDGTISFVNVTSLRLNDIFDALSIAYFVDMYIDSMSVPAEYVYGRMCNAGIPITTTNYNYSSFGTSAWPGTFFSNGSTGLTAWYMALATASQAHAHSEHVIWNAGQAKRTILQSINMYARGDTAPNYMAVQDVTGAGQNPCSDLQIYPGSGNMTGRIKVRRKW